MIAKISLPSVRSSITHRVEITDPEQGIFDFYLIVGLYEDGRPGELFIKMGKEGSTLRGLLDTIGIQTSLMLQYGIPLDVICEKLAGLRFSPAGSTNNIEIPECCSVANYIYKWLENRFGLFLEGKNG